MAVRQAILRLRPRQRSCLSLACLASRSSSHSIPFLHDSREPRFTAYHANTPCAPADGRPVPPTISHRTSRCLPCHIGSHAQTRPHSCTPQRRRPREVLALRESTHSQATISSPFHRLSTCAGDVPWKRETTAGLLHLRPTRQQLY